MKELGVDRIPWFAIPGALLILSLLMYTTSQAGFMEILVPTYLTEALLFICIGLTFCKEVDFGHKSIELFLMSGVWLLNQILHWGGAWGRSPTMLGTICWILLLMQLYLAYLVYTGGDLFGIKGLNGGAVWGDAAVWLILLFGLGKLLLNLAYGAPLTGAMPLWGLGAVILSLGYALSIVEDEVGGYLALFGTLVMAYAALTIGGPGLSFF